MTSLTESLQEPTRANRLFFVLSGEHASLPAAEVGAILESSGVEFNAPTQSYRLLTLNAPFAALKAVSERSLMYDWCGLSLGECAADERQIEDFVRSQPIGQVARDAQNFAVRSVRLGGVNKSIRRVDLERKVGSVVKDMVPRMQVRLQNPDLTFACVLYEDRFLLGVSGYSKPSGLIAPRRPRKRPVFHPSTMPPKIARCMVNLARAVPGSTFVDPFSGVGGIVIEAAVIGCRVLGLDADLRMLRGARRNLKHFELAAEGFLNADARFLPGHELDAIATDPPYGRGSSTMGTKVTTLVSEFIEGAKSSLKKDAHICISAPVEVDVEGYAQHAGFALKEKHLARVHRSLTRQFVVLQNS
ncbi:MAG: RsmD family RNA methyltransferase [Candidatus Bathyarchaeia archaeon]